MSDYAYVADRARKAFSSVARLENELIARPNDRALSINLMSMRRVAASASAEMERIAALNSIEICRYRLVPVRYNEYGLGHVARTLFEYQNLFSQIHDAIKNGKKSKAQINIEAAYESTMDFAYTYSGSLGVVLLARSQKEFFGASLDRSIDALYQVMSIADSDDVRNVAQNLGRAVVKRIHDWSVANVQGGFASDIQWKKSDGSIRGQIIDKDQLARIAEFIQASSDEEKSEIKTSAILVGADLVSRRFHLSEPDGESYQGAFAESVVLPMPLPIGRTYDAIIEVAERYFYATEKSVRAYTLKELSLPTDAPRRP